MRYSLSESDALQKLSICGGRQNLFERLQCVLLPHIYDVVIETG